MNRKLRIMTVCSFGIGTSLILKMKIDEVLTKHNIDAEVIPCDMTTAPNEICDMCFTSNDIGSLLSEKINVPIIIINNFFDTSEIEKKGLAIWSTFYK